MGLRLSLGRGFTGRDDKQAARVALINQTAARKYFPDGNPIGRRFGSSIETAGQIEVVGVVSDAKYDSLRDPVPPTMYVPFMQVRTPSAVFEVRTAGDPIGTTGAIREAVRTIDPNLPLMDVSTQAEQVEKRLQHERVFAQAYTLFGALALVLAAVGLFGLMSYSVARRTNEIGIRMALGAEEGDVLSLVMRESLALVVLGMVIGIAGAVATSRLAANLVFGLSPTDVPTMVAAVAVLMVVSACAGYLPARQAARVDPLIALRYE
jgi:predicted permease